MQFSIGYKRLVVLVTVSTLEVSFSGCTKQVPISTKTIANNYTEVQSTEVTKPTEEIISKLETILVSSDLLNSFLKEYKLQNLSTEDARVAYALYALEQHYGGECQLATELEDLAINSSDVDLGDKTVIETGVKIHPKDKPDITIKAFVTNTGEEYDDYYTYLFGNEILEIYKSKFSDLKLPSEPTFMLETIPLSEVFGNAKSYLDNNLCDISVIATVSPDLEIDEYVKITREWLDTIKDVDKTNDWYFELHLPDVDGIPQLLYLTDCDAIEYETDEDIRQAIEDNLSLRLLTY